MSGRFRWKPVAVLATLLIVGVAGACFVIRSGMAHERKEFLTERDPESGCRYRFTISTDWNVNSQTMGVHSGKRIGFLSIQAPANPPFRQWVNDSLLHRAPSKPVTIQTFSFIVAARSRRYHLVEGYPEAASSPLARVLARKRLRIDGHPAVLSRLEIKMTGANYQFSALTIYFPENSALYDMYSVSDPVQGDQVYQELQTDQRLLPHRESAGFPRPQALIRAERGSAPEQEATEEVRNRAEMTYGTAGGRR